MDQIIKLINDYYDYAQKVPVLSLVNAIALLGYSSVVWKSLKTPKSIKKSVKTKLFIFGELGFLLTLPSFDEIRFRILHLIVFYASQIYVIAQAAAYNDTITRCLYAAEADADNSEQKKDTNQ